MANATNKPTYTIDSQNRIAVDHSGESIPEGMATFTSESELAALAADWPGSRLVEIWNGLPGNTPVKKFTNRKTAVRRIWKAVQVLGMAEPSGARDPKQGRARRTKGRAQPIPAKSPGTKSNIVLALLRQTGGATLQALMTATGWQAHSVRGFISGQLTKKMRLKVKSFKRDGERVYSIRS